MVWNLRIPPRIHIFFWLLSNNKTLTRTNLAKRKILEDISCLFCAEDESVHHLFFGCCVATLMWKHLYDIFNIQIGVNFESIARWWISNKKNSVLNMCGACITMVHLETKKRYVFSEEELERREGTTEQVGADVGVLPLCKEESVEKLNWVIRSWKTKSQQPLQLAASPQSLQRGGLLHSQYWFRCHQS